MRVIILENDILIADGNINKQSFKDIFFDLEFDIFLDNHFLKNFNLKVFNINEIKKMKKSNYILLFEDLSCKSLLLYGVYVKNLNLGEIKSNICLHIDHYSEIIDIDTDYSKNMWLKHNRNMRIDKILG